MTMRSWLVTAIASVMVTLSPCHLVTLSSARGEDVIDSPMYRNPVLPVPKVVNTFADGLLTLWLEAFERPEKDLKCRVALSIAAAREQGMPDLKRAVAPLMRELDRQDLDPTVRLAVARALVALDAREAAPRLLLLASSEGGDLRELVDPALVRWDHKPARAVWLERLGQPPYRRATVLAIHSLVAVREEKAVPQLRELVLDRDVAPGVRLEAARALAVLRPAGSEEDAQRLAADTSPAAIGKRLAAATLLRQHKGDAAVRLLQTLAVDAEPAVAAIALARLVEIDVKLVNPMLDSVLTSPDGKVRGFGVETLFRQPSDGNIVKLGDRLDDAHPEVRAQARRALRDLAVQPGWRSPAIREGERALATDDWRGLEQATILLAEIDHKPAARRLVELLSFDRPEVLVAAAWGLRRLAVPDTLAPSLDYYRHTFAGGREAGERNLPEAAVDQQLCQLGQFFGQSKYVPADMTLRQLIPIMARAGPEARAAAIWALGRLHEGKPVPAVVGAFDGRIRAVVPFDTDDLRVRRMAAVGMGLMKAKDGLPVLREFYRAKAPSLDIVNNACGWAIEKIAGEPVPAATVEIRQRGWFLTPIK